MPIKPTMGFLPFFLLSPLSVAQVPTADLAKVPPDARHYVIESAGGKHGDSWTWVDADGVRMGRESLNLRGQVWEVDFRGTADSDGLPLAVAIRGISPQGDAGETFNVQDELANWRSPVDGGSATAAPRTFYVPYGGPEEATAWLLDRLLAEPDKTLKLYPGGKAHAEQLTNLEVQSRSGERQTINLWAISGLSNSPALMWADARNRFFAQTSLVGWLPEEYAAEQQHLELVQARAMSAKTASLAQALGMMPARPVAFVNVRMLDADARRFLSGQTIVVDGSKIVAVGPADSVTVPATALIVDGKGKTLLPGLWDCHMHVGDDFTGVQELSLGVTSVRDPGNNDAATIDRRTRVAAGQLLFPHVYPSSLIDGKGPYTAQVANVATTREEAIALVKKAKANGFWGVKFYGTFNPAWLKASIAEAHKLGLHVHGHIPAGIRPMDAINDGYDEITHINWVIMQAMPESVIAVSNGIMRFEGPGRYAKDVDLDAGAMTSIVSTMSRKQIYSDPTMVAFEGLYVPDNGDLSPAYMPFSGTLPPAAERNFRAGGFAVPKDLTRADYRASWKTMLALLGRMHKAGVPIVAGTDGSGIEIVREIEIYTEAGFTAAEAIAAATIVPARLTGADKSTGSIKVGKNADLVLVEGDPSVNVGDLRHTRIVLLDGRLFDGDQLRDAAGFSGRPK